MKLPCQQVLLTGINLEASPYATTQRLIALRDTDLRGKISKISIPTAIFHGAKDLICEFALAEQLRQGIEDSYVVETAATACLLKNWKNSTPNYCPSCKGRSAVNRGYLKPQVHTTPAHFPNEPCNMSAIQNFALDLKMPSISSTCDLNPIYREVLNHTQ